MIDRRSLIALGISVPLASAFLRLDHPDPRVHPLNTGGARIISISPNGKTLVGIDNSDQLHFFQAGSTEFPVETNALPEVGVINPYSVSWSPDNSHIAFSLDAWRLMRDSDIFIADVNSGELTNVTPEGHEREADTLMNEPDVDIDMFPVWLDDDTLIFSRHRFVEDEDNSVMLISLSLSDGTTETWVDLSPAGVMYVTSPIWQITDGSMVFGTESRDATGPYSGVMIVGPDGTSRELDLDGLGHLQVVDVNDTHMVVVAVGTFEYWYIPLDSPAESEMLWDRFELPGNVSMRSEVALGPDPDTVLVVVENENDQTFVLRLDDSGSTEVAELLPGGGSLNVSWAEDVILVTSDDPAWLIVPED